MYIFSMKFWEGIEGLRYLFTNINKFNRFGYVRDYVLWLG